MKLGVVAAVIIVSAVLAVPPKKKIHLGLDLQGGLHLVLEVLVDKAVERALEALDEEAEKADAARWPVENGPAPAYLDALRFYASDGEPERAEELKSRAQRYLHGARYHRAKELDSRGD